MAFNYSPRVITDGLVLYLDAANTRSYPGTGTTWSDLSRGGNNGVLTNGPTFNSANGGSIMFDGTNDFATTSTNPQLGSGAYAVSVWFKPSVLQANNATLVCVNAAAATNNWQMNFTTFGEIYFFVTNVTFLATGITPTVDVWNNVTVVRENTGTNGVKSYHNGVFTAQTTNSTDLNYTEGIQIGLNRGDTAYFNGNIAQILLYSGYGLSSSEVLQNFNATRARFGI